MNFFLNHSRLARVILISVVGVLLLLILFSLFSVMRPGFGLSTTDRAVPFYTSADMALESDFSMVRSSPVSTHSPTPASGQPVTQELLQDFETTDYQLYLRTQNLESACAVLSDLRQDNRTDFRNINLRENSCTATFYVAEAHVEAVLTILKEINNLQIEKTTRSITRQRQQVSSSLEIAQRHLSEVENLLEQTRASYAELANSARADRDSDTLTKIIRDQVEMIDMLTGRQHQLSQQVNHLYRQQQDLEERLGMIEIRASFTRLFSTDPHSASRRTEEAKDLLQETVTTFKLAMTSFLGVFLLWLLITSFFSLFIILAIRLLWRFIKLVWKRV